MDQTTDPGSPIASPLFIFYTLLIAFASAYIALNSQETTREKVREAFKAFHLRPESTAAPSVSVLPASETEDISRAEDTDDLVDNSTSETGDVKKPRKKTFHMLYGTTTGTTKTVADWLATKLKVASTTSCAIENLAEYDQDRLELIGSDDDTVDGESNDLYEMCIFVVSTYTDGEPPESCAKFFEWLKDMVLDFRVDKGKFLSNLQFCVVGLGSEEYDAVGNYCTAAKTLRSHLLQLGATEVVEMLLLNDQEETKEQLTKLVSSLKTVPELSLNGKQKQCDDLSNQAPVMSSSEPEPKPEEVEMENLINDQFLQQGDEADAEAEDYGDSDLEEKEEGGSSLVDVEDLIDSATAASMLGTVDKEKREMVTKAQRKSLTKSGYKIIGSHSAVKLCRWTKHQLRGRGGCYKHTFYNITSYQCMEMTPSLACANKCVFCWRHHKNPVGTSWRWKEDPPNQIVETAIELHRQMIKTMRGVPGVKPDRLKAAFTVRHCALSLVGEPIMYPRINTLIRRLHKEGISSFLVTNGQFPDAIERLEPVTQLYVSIDAGDKDSLKKIDRPLFKDFWERYVTSLRLLKEKRQRTVYRFTMVKKWNFDEAAEREEMSNYARLIQLGEPDLIEIKAVTYCGTSAASSLTMKNVPWHYEVKKFAEVLCEVVNQQLDSTQSKVQYGTACEHVHSCCVLLARKDTFLKEGQWHTWIDFEKFHELMQAYYDSNGTKTFISSDYICKTPTWALWNATEEGFDPVETRFRKVRNHPGKS